MSNKMFGYARVSTIGQNEDRQVIDLLEYGIDERDIYVDKQSGRSFERTNYLALRNTVLREGEEHPGAGIAHHDAYATAHFGIVAMH